MQPLALTPGEPAGIGPDICVQLARRGWEFPVVAFADAGMLAERARGLGLELTIRQVETPPREPAAAGQLYVHHCRCATPSVPGRLERANSEYVLECLRQATAACLRDGYAALVTGPVHKGIINDAGIPFTGHTEFLAELSGGHPVMMLACPELRVALATTHLPLRQVADAITPELLRRTLEVLYRDLQRRFGLPQPRILVCGLNPHAGEGGHLGREEIEIIEPTLERLRQCGMDLIGPLPADSLFTPRYLRQADAVLAMYHDQGLPVLKHLGFGRAVNITLGLPLIRTSVDHGTALELAGSGLAETGSLDYALREAQRMHEISRESAP